MFRHPYPTLAGMLVLVLLAMPTAAFARQEATTHRFAPAREVTVTFALAKRNASGTLLHFEQNRVSLIRRRGRLTLLSRGRHSGRIAATRRREPRVVISLDAATGRATLTVSRRTASLAARLLPERSVAVRKHAFIGLRISTRNQRPAAPTASLVSAAPALPTPPLVAARLFAPDSVWNAPLPANAPLDPANNALVRTLRDTVAQNEAARWGPWIATEHTPPLYIVPANQPTVRVQLDPGSWKVGLQQAFESVPLPPNAKPAPGADAQLTVWQPSTDHLWELFQARKLADGWHASFGGAMANVAQSPGYYDTSSWPGLSQPWWGATATSLPAIAGTVMIDELKAGVIPHALAMNIPWAKPSVYSLPAQRTDGRSTDPNAIPEGARFRLDPKLNIDALNVPLMTRMLAKAAQRYGMIVRDQTGHGISFFAENPAQSGTDPYATRSGFYGGPDPSAVMRAFPWDHVQLVKMDLHRMG
jgi:hypothetical protein